MASAADAKRVSADLREFYRTSVSGHLCSITVGLDLVITKEPYSRVRILFDGPPGAPTHTCRVDVSPTTCRPADRCRCSERDLRLGAGATTVLPERKNNPHSGGGHPRVELTHWKTRMDDTEAEIELNVTTGSWPKLN